jgi:flagellar biosynthetic protein FlhB
MFTIQTVMRLIKSLLQAAAVGWAAYAVLKAEWNNLLPLFYQTPEHIASYLLSSGYTMVWYSLVPLLVVGVADLVYTRWKYQEDLKMTKDEVKDERKQMDGSPEVKLAQRRKMAQMLKKRMMDQVPKADVILTNPTHLAVALRYDPLESAAPTVVAKGADFLAERIKEVARENRVPIRENKPLARALYKDVEVGEAIPEELYQAVATVLAEIYKVKGRKR